MQTVKIPNSLMPEFMAWARQQGQSLKYKADGTIAAATNKAKKPGTARQPINSSKWAN